jgi:SAM-dependent methyltransferase
MTSGGVRINTTARFSILNIEPNLQISSQDFDKESLFHRIFDQESYQIASESSANERKALTTRNSTLTYGEILYESFTDIFLMTLARDEYLSSAVVGGGGIFIDLGSGTGKASVIAALNSNFKSCIGIEILSSLHQMALESLVSWSELSSIHHSVTKIQYLEGSFLDLNFFDWTIGDLVFANSTCFGREMMSQISKHAGRSSRPSSLTVPDPTEAHFPSRENEEKLFLYHIHLSS